jgi:hypothetical protein
VGAIAELPIHFQPKQWQAFTTPATEVLYGGAAFGGKSHLIRAAAIMWCTEIPGLQVYLFRRVEEDLLKNHMEGPSGFRNMLAAWVRVGLVTIVETEIRFNFNGARIYLCHCKDEAHRFKYHGAEIHVLIIDELTHFTEIIYRYLRFRVRMVGINLPERYRKGAVGPNGQKNEQNLFPRVLNASNPGNIGHHWVKRTWGLESARGISKPTRMPDNEGGMVRQYIPARVADNPIGVDADPTYVARMRGLGDPALVRAMESGDWNIIAGGFFPEFSLERHVLAAVQLPMNVFTRRFIAADWGSARPFSVGWYGIADEDWKAKGVLGNEILVPRGGLVRYREWYGKKEGEDNKGIKLIVERWAAGVLERSGTEPIRYTVVDTSMFDEDGGPSLAERAMKVKLNDKALNLRPADKRRLPGWEQMRSRLVGTDGDNPLLFLMDNQQEAIRVIQAVQHDETKVEDLDTDQEDHPVDEIRYACMSRPLPAMKPGEKRRPKGPRPFTMDWLAELDKQQGGSSGYRME